MKNYIVVYEYKADEPFCHAHMQKDLEELDGAVSDFSAKILGQRIAQEEADERNGKLTFCRVYKQI